uniref:Uncharacterized protein n=1 Tax=Cacopsylla melanoneura TaxID=428564 RepID=A0A8D8Z174_9HEMI
MPPLNNEFTKIIAFSRLRWCSTLDLCSFSFPQILKRSDIYLLNKTRCMLRTEARESRRGGILSGIKGMRDSNWGWWGRLTNLEFYYHTFMKAHAVCSNFLM